MRVIFQYAVLRHPIQTILERLSPNYLYSGMLRQFILLYLLSLFATASSPNFIIIFTDDQGYGDLGCFGSKTIKTPNIDQMATEGIRLTDFHVASPVCTPSRAALLTGCYPKRVGLHQHVLFPSSKKGLNPELTTTIADILKTKGYATACVGKWHLGHHAPTLPMAHGFDSYYGIPYSNDMSHPNNKHPSKETRQQHQDDVWNNQADSFKRWNTPLMENEKIIEIPVDQRTVTRRYTNKAIDFVKTNKDKPFFLYLAHTMPHIPLFVPDDVRDPDPQNAYTCTIEHIDDEVGRLMKTVRELGIEDNTWVIYTTDNGPWLSFKNHGGSAGPLRAGKGTTYEGGQRVPFIAWAPGRIPAGTSSDELVASMDLLPTIAHLAGATLPEDKIDGQNIADCLTSNASSPRTEFVHYTSNGVLDGIRIGDWKLRGHGNKKKPNYELYNLSEDLGETANLAEKLPDRLESMITRMKELDKEVTENSVKTWQLEDKK